MARKLLSVGAVLAALAVLPAGEAVAKSPPRGIYTCSYLTSFGYAAGPSITIRKKSRYSVNGSRKKYKFKTKGRKITWKKGPFKGVWRAKWHRNKHHNAIIDLYFPEDRAYETPQETCSKVSKKK